MLMMIMIFSFCLPKIVVKIESIKMSGADIAAAFDKYKFNNKKRLNDLDAKFGDILNKSDLDKETQFD